MSHHKMKAAARERVLTSASISRSMTSAANPIDAVTRIVGRQVGLIRGYDDG